MTDQESDSSLVSRLRFEAGPVVDRGIVTRGQRIVIRDLLLQAADMIEALEREVPIA